MTVRGVGTGLAFVLAGMALAGCAGGAGGDGAGQASLGGGPPPLAATATTGVIRGVVVDEAIRPLANASVEARGPGGAQRTATSDASGFFGLADLAPGTWFVGAAKLAYAPAQASAEVVAGVDDPPVVKLQLVFVPGAAPFVTEVKIEAFVQCIVPGANLCAIVNLYPCAVAGYCEPIVDDTSFIVLHDELVAVQRVPDWLQTEMVWQSTQAVSPALSIRYSAHSPEDGAGLDARQDRVAGESPLVIRMPRPTLEEWETGVGSGIAHEIFGHTEAGSAVGSFGIVLNQRVSFYFHAFYGYAPGEAWQFSVDGAAPQPPQ